MAISNVAIRPMYVYLGKNTKQIETISCVPATDLDGKYFLFTTPAGAKHYAWFNTGASVDPAPAGGWVGHEVDVLVTDSSTAVALALKLIIDAMTEFTAIVTGKVVTMTHVANGYAQPARDGLAPTLFGFKVAVLGQVEKSAGCIDGDIEISGFEQDVEPITCHASGTTERGEIIKGYSRPEVTLTFKETDLTTLKETFRFAGMNSFTPEGADAVEVFGYGPANVGGQNPTIYMRLHPVADSTSEKDGDWNFWKASLKLDTFTFSGENIATIPVTFSVYPDESITPKQAQMIFIGDAVQAGYII